MFSANLSRCPDRVRLVAELRRPDVRGHLAGLDRSFHRRHQLHVVRERDPDTVDSPSRWPSARPSRTSCTFGWVWPRRDRRGGQPIIDNVALSANLRSGSWSARHGGAPRSGSRGSSLAFAGAAPDRPERENEVEPPPVWGGGSFSSRRCALTRSRLVQRGGAPRPRRATGSPSTMCRTRMPGGHGENLLASERFWPYQTRSPALGSRFPSAPRGPDSGRARQGPRRLRPRGLPSCRSARRASTWWSGATRSVWKGRQGGAELRVRTRLRGSSIRLPRRSTRSRSGAKLASSSACSPTRGERSSARSSASSRRSKSSAPACC